MKSKRMIKGFLSIAVMALLLAACGGGGGTTGDSSGTVAVPGTGTATIQGQVSGTTVIAVDDDTDLEAGRVTASGTPKTFGMTLPTGNAYRFYLMVNEGAGNAGRIYPVYMGSTNVFQMTSAANNHTIDLGMVSPDFTKGNAFPANNPMGYPGVMAGGENRSIPPFLSGAAFSMGDLQGTWDFNSLATSGTIGWMHGVLFVDNTGMGGMTSLIRNGMPWPSTDNVPFSMFPCGIVGMGDDNTFHGVLSQDKNMMVVTRTGASGHYDLMVLMRSDAGAPYSTTDLTGDWMQHGVISGNPNDTDWNFGQMVMDPTGQAAFNGMMGRTGAFSMQPATFAMNSSGVITMGGTGMGGGMMNPMMAQTYSGLMNPAKDLMVATFSDGNGGYQLGIGMK